MVIPMRKAVGPRPRSSPLPRTASVCRRDRKRQAVTNPRNTVFSIKRFMGRKYHEVQHEISLVPYQVVEAKNGDAHVKIGDKTYSPPEISAMILQKLKTDAEAYLGEKITER